MTISNIPPSSSGPILGPGVDDFRRAAQAGDQVQLQVDGDAYRLIATGKTPSGRSVAWVDGGLDTTRMFVDALDRAYGPGLARAVANELDLRPTAAPLPSDKIEQALKMADTAAGALDGVRFAEMLASRATGEPPTKA